MQFCNPACLTELIIPSLLHSFLFLFTKRCLATADTAAAIAATTASAATAALAATNGTAANPSAAAAAATIASTAATSATNTATATVTGGYTLRQAAEHCLRSIFFLFS